METFPTEAELEALRRCFERARGCSGGQSRVRRLLFAWHNARELGGLDLTDLWSLDDSYRADALTVIGMIARSPSGWYAEHYGLRPEMDALIERYGPQGRHVGEKCPECGERVEHYCDREGYRRRLAEERAERERWDR